MAPSTQSSSGASMAATRSTAFKTITTMCVLLSVYLICLVNGLIFRSFQTADDDTLIMYYYVGGYTLLFDILFITAATFIGIASCKARDAIAGVLSLVLFYCLANNVNWFIVKVFVLNPVDDIWTTYLLARPCIFVFDLTVYFIAVIATFTWRYHRQNGWECRIPSSAGKLLDTAGKLLDAFTAFFEKAHIYIRILMNVYLVYWLAAVMVIVEFFTFQALINEALLHHDKFGTLEAYRQMREWIQAFVIPVLWLAIIACYVWRKISPGVPVCLVAIFSALLWCRYAEWLLSF